MERYMFLNPKQFDKWVDERSKQMIYNENYEYFTGSGCPCIYVVNRNNGKVFTAKLNPNDNFNIHVGIAVAYSRALGNKIAIKIKKHITDINKLEELIDQTCIIKMTFKDRFEYVTLDNKRLNQLKYRWDLIEYCYLI